MVEQWMKREGLFAALCGAALCLVLAAYANHYDNSFHFDDSHVIENNLYIRDLGNAVRFFTDASTYSSLPENASYRPLVTLFSALDYRLAGGLDQRQFHRTQMALLLFLSALLVQFLRRLADLARPDPGNRYIALFAATLFAVHTANAETINYISCRSSLLATLCVVLAFVVYFEWPRGRRFHLYLIPFALGALAKPLAVMFAPLLFVFVLMFERRASGEPGIRAGRQSFVEAVRETWPAFAAAVALYVFVRLMEPEALLLATVSRWSYLLTQPFVWLHYFRLFLLPVGLTADTDLQVFTAWYDTRAFAGILFVGALMIAIFVLGRTKRMLPAAFGLAWFALALLPTSSLFPLSEVYNEHRIFFPYVGLSLTFAWLAAVAVARAAARWRKPGVSTVVATVLVVAILAAHGVGTFQRNRVWKDSETLWLDVTNKSPENGRAWMNYGLELMERGDLGGALSRFERARELLPAYPYLETNLGIVQAGLGRDDIAEQHFRRALEIAPRFAQGMFFYARWLVEAARGPEALHQLAGSLEISPAASEVRALYTRLLAAIGEEAGLVGMVERTLALDPADPMALAYAEGRLPFAAEATPAEYGALGAEKISQRNWLDAAAVYRHVLAADGSSAAAWNNLGWALGNLGFYRLAAAAFERALDLDPAMEIARANLSWALKASGG